MTAQARNGAPCPGWVPDCARLYLRHTEQGVSLREIARQEGMHPSTVLRMVRRLETRRDDPLVDEVLDHLGRSIPPPIRLPERRPDRDTGATDKSRQEGQPQMTVTIRKPQTIADAGVVMREARRILRRLCEPGAVLAVAPDLEKAAVLKGELRIAVLDRTVAQAFALKDWIAVAQSGKIVTYAITPAGRAALKRMIETETPEHVEGFAEAQSPFAAQHRVWGNRDAQETGADRPRKLRVNLAESPVAVLARRRDGDGTPFLSPELVAAAERLREDFELAQMGPRVAQNWDRFLTGADRGGFGPGLVPGEGGSGRARERVAAALRELGPGLGDVALRCCCYLEGLEVAEKRMGWSARSGKIVLRIALARLRRHYDETYGGRAPLIG
ncbi:MAG: DUF6456 domain-containing protein [Pseudomonadota bacterium]